MEGAETSNIYKLAGLPLTPAGIEELIIELFDGKIVERHEIVSAVEKVHHERGGIAPRAANLASSVKKALQGLKDRGVANNPMTGFWKIESGTAKHPIEILAESTVEIPAPVEHLDAEMVLGEGPSSVYLYFFPTYRSLALKDGRSTWPCKVGLSERDPISRIYSQVSTALPEPPTIGLLLRTSLPSQWEKAIHTVLALRGRVIEDAPGAEWFETSVSEVVEIIRFINPAIDTKI